MSQGLGERACWGHRESIGSVGWNRGSPKQACDGDRLEWKKLTGGGAARWSLAMECGRWRSEVGRRGSWNRWLGRRTTEESNCQGPLSRAVTRWRGSLWRSVARRLKLESSAARRGDRGKAFAWIKRQREDVVVADDGERKRRKQRAEQGRGGRA
jgi:hypothetical protein